MRNFVKQFAIPLQALAALGICLGMVWMVFVVAGFNPAPPTALDLQSRSTEDQSFASMNSTAAALAFEMVAEMMPSPIVMPVTGNSTPIPFSSPTIAVTLRVVSSGSESNTPSSIFSFIFQPTQTREQRNDSPKPTPTPTRTLRPTFTLVPPTITKTNTPPPSPTHSPLPPTITPSLVPTTIVPTMAIPTTAVPTTSVPTTDLPPPTEEPPPIETEPSETAPPIQNTPEPTSEQATATP